MAKRYIREENKKSDDYSEGFYNAMGMLANTLNIDLTQLLIDIEDNKYYVITGPNGSGKSTLAKIIMGIEKQDSGKILLNGKDISNWSIDKRAKNGIAFAFQQPVRFKGITVKDLIEKHA